MKDVQQVIEVLLGKRPAGFRNKHLAEALGVSQARASQLLKPRLLSGELARTGEGYGKYIRGPDRVNARGGVARGAVPGCFWRALAEECPKLAYVALGRLALTDLRTRKQVQSALRDLVPDHTFLVVDFEGVQSISPAACHELFLRMTRRWCTFVEPINLGATVAWSVSQVLRFGNPAFP